MQHIRVSKKIKHHILSRRLEKKSNEKEFHLADPQTANLWKGHHTPLLFYLLLYHGRPFSMPTSSHKEYIQFFFSNLFTILDSSLCFFLVFFLFLSYLFLFLSCFFFYFLTLQFISRFTIRPVGFFNLTLIVSQLRESPAVYCIVDVRKK